MFFLFVCFIVYKTQKNLNSRSMNQWWYNILWLMTCRIWISCSLKYLVVTFEKLGGCGNAGIHLHVYSFCYQWHASWWWPSLNLNALANKVIVSTVCVIIICIVYGACIQQMYPHDWLNEQGLRQVTWITALMHCTCIVVHVHVHVGLYPIAWADQKGPPV